MYYCNQNSEDSAQKSGNSFDFICYFMAKLNVDGT